MKKILQILSLSLLFVVGTGCTQWLAGEDSWICEDGEWVKHGVPSAPKPDKACPKDSKKTETSTESPDIAEEKIPDKEPEQADKGLKVEGGVLDVSNQGLTEFPKEILKYTLIKKLVLSNNNLKTLPAEIGELVNLEELYLDHNQLDGAIVAEIRKMPKLRILDASHNNMTGIPAEIGQLRNLEILDYGNNFLDTMPNEIENLRDNLDVLNLENNKYSPEMIREIEDKLPGTQVIF